MSNEDTRFSRRRAMALLLGVGAGSYALFTTSTKPVIASTLTISDGSVTTDNGVITNLTLTINSDVTWDGAETDPGSTTVKLQLKNSGSWETLATHSTTLSGLAGTHEHTFSSIDVISNSSWSKSDFNASGDGVSENTELDARLTVTTGNDVDGDGSNDTFNSNEETFTITVQNETNSNSAGGNGNPTVSGTDKSP